MVPGFDSPNFARLSWKELNASEAAFDMGLSVRKESGELDFGSTIGVDGMLCGKVMMGVVDDAIVAIGNRWLSEEKRRKDRDQTRNKTQETCRKANHQNENEVAIAMASSRGPTDEMLVVERASCGQGQVGDG